MEQRVDREEAVTEAWQRLDGEDCETDALQRKFEEEECEQRLSDELATLKARLSE